MKRRVLVIATCLSALAAISGGAASPDGPRDACALLTPDEVKSIVGAEVGAGERHDEGDIADGGYSSTCLWKIVGAPVPSAGPEAPFNGARFAMLNTILWPVGSNKAAKYLEDFRDAAKSNLIDMTPIPVSVGDEGLWWGDGVASRVANVSFGVSAHIGPDKALERATEEALAKKVAPKVNQLLVRPQVSH